MKLFWEKGYNATSAQDLVNALGISRSSLYDTYGDKHSLFVNALKKYREERINPVLQAVDTTEDALCKAIEKGQRTGIFTTQHDARSLAKFVFNSVNGLRVTVKFDVDKKMFDDIIHITLAALKK